MNGTAFLRRLHGHLCTHGLQYLTDRDLICSGSAIPNGMEWGALLLAEGDKQLCERTGRGWLLRIEYATTTAPQGILRLRANKAAAKQHTGEHNTESPVTPPRQPDIPSDHHATASSLHEVPRSYYPPLSQQHKPTRAAASSSSSAPNTPAATTT